MSDSPKVTVYLVSHNHQDFVEQAIESVLSQSYDDWELIIFDDRSTDRTREILEFYRGDDRVEIVHTDGVGLVKICNMAIARAKGDYIIRLDGDDVFDEDILLVLSNYLDRRTEHALVFPDYYMIDEFGNIASREWREKIYETNQMLDMPPHGACTMIRKTLLEELGGYRADIAAQDGFDLWVKVSGRHRSGNVNIPLFYYRRHTSNLTNDVHRIVDARRQIKRDAVLDKMPLHKPIIAVLPCRQSYDFTPNLWAEEVNGKSLLRRALEVYSRSSIFDHVVVACDNPETERELERFDDSRMSFFLRKRETTLRTHSVAPTVEEIVTPLDPSGQGVTLLHYVQAPFVTPSTVEEAVTSLILNEADTCFGVEEVVDRLFRRSSQSLQTINRSGGLNSDFSSVYREIGAVTAVQNKVLRFGSLSGPRQISFVATPEEAVQINNRMNLDFANMIAARVDAETMERARLAAQ